MPPTSNGRARCTTTFWTPSTGRWPRASPIRRGSPSWAAATAGTRRRSAAPSRPHRSPSPPPTLGISNVMPFLNTIPAYWTPWKSIWKVRMGDYPSDAGRRFLEERSPLNFADRIVRPLLIGQGANDPRVKASESEQIVAALQKHGIPVAYGCYPDEGHGLRQPENRRSFNAVAEAFLAKHLGGRCEPVGQDFETSTIHVKAVSE